MRVHWKERYAKGGVCDFKQNYDFYFKWLLNKTAQCFYITGLPDTINETYLKTNLLLDGNICITDFNDKLYACIGSVGGPPNEYYVGTIYTIANPVLGSKMVNIGKDGVVIYNNAIDEFTGDCWVSGLYELINQTATLLADNIVSISCNQINCRVHAMVTAESEAQAIAGEIALKKMYAGHPYQVLRSDLIDKISVNPINTAADGQNISELVELNNYIISSYFQSIGIRANDIRKKSHVLQDEIDVQNDYLQVSIYEIVTSWQKGFDKTNELYGTDIHVELNPAIIHTLIDAFVGNSNNTDDTSDDSNPTDDISINDKNDTSEGEPDASGDESERVMNEKLEAESVNTGVSVDTEPEPTAGSVDLSKDAAEELSNYNNQIEQVIDLINDATDNEEVDDDEQTSETDSDSE